MGHLSFQDGDGGHQDAGDVDKFCVGDHSDGRRHGELPHEIHRSDTYCKFVGLPMREDGCPCSKESKGVKQKKKKYDAE